MPYLIDDLADRELTDEAHLAGRAEGAGHRTARLRREAHRVPRAVMRHEDALDVMAVVQTEKGLARLAVGALDLVHELHGAPAERRRQRAPQSHWQIRERLPIASGTARDVPPDLPRAIGRLAVVAEPDRERALVDVADGGGRRPGRLRP